MMIRPPDNRAEHRQALAALINRGGTADPLLDERIATLERYARQRNLSLDHCLVAVESGSIEGVCLCLDSPGRTSSILLSASLALPRYRDVAVRMLAQAEAEAAARGIQLLQGMVPPEISQESLLYAACGFEHLAGLIYMQSHLGTLKLPSRHPEALSWEYYSEQNHDTFARVIEGTYQDSLDCGSLNGVRDIEDILASHKATGQFDPRFWWLGSLEGRFAGVLLLSYVDEQRSYELVYMGCLPECRRRGIGARLLRHGIECVLQRGMESMTLSVDEKNTPARKLYTRFGFRELTRRDVWIRILHPKE